MWKNKQTDAPYVLVVKGDKIDHPSLVQGNRAKMKILPIDVNADIPMRDLQEILLLAKPFIESDFPEPQQQNFNTQENQGCDDAPPP